MYLNPKPIKENIYYLNNLMILNIILIKYHYNTKYYYHYIA
jgi:hypothetical protein